MLEETVERPPQATYYGHYASVTGLPSELAMSACDTASHNAEQRADDMERFEDGLTQAELDWRFGLWLGRNPMPVLDDIDTPTTAWVEWNQKQAAARRRMYDPLMQDLIDANGGNPVDHGTILMGMDA